MQIKIYSGYDENDKQVYQDILELTSSVNDTYPGYKDWFDNKFIEGLKQGNRSCIVVFDNDKAIGCALLKKSSEEKKICTLFVKDNYRKQGLATKLLQKSIEQLGEKPLITVSSRNIRQLAPLLLKMGFHLSARKKDVYQKGDSEFYFNDKKADIVKNRVLPFFLALIKEKN